MDSIHEDYYTILGVPPTATAEEIKHAYRALARRYHPDSRTEPAPTTLFHQVQAAYAVLSDPARRQAYDKRRAEAGLTTNAPLTWRIHLSRHHLSTQYAEQTLYLMLEIHPTGVETHRRLPLNLCLVIDQSTSMQGSRMEHVKRAARWILAELDDDDFLSIVTFNDRANVLLPSAPVGSRRNRAQSKISSILTGGGTEILQGLQTGLEEIKKHHSERVVSHLILLTDGQTYGDEEDCLAEARAAGAQQIGISAMGIGEDWNDTLLDEMAVQSGGISAYITSPQHIRTMLRKRIVGLSALYATDLHLAFRSTEKVQVEHVFSTTPYLKHLRLEGDGVKLGGIEGNQPITVVAEIGVGRHSAGEHRLLQLELSGSVPRANIEGVLLRDEVICHFTEEEPPEEPVPTAMLSVLSKVTIFRMQEQVWEKLDQGNVRDATRQLEYIATRLFDLGETELARSAMLEAGRVAQSGTSTSKGRKELKYGTRSLTIVSRRESHD